MKEFLENDINSHYKLVYEFGYINLLFDNKSDSICYLVMSNLELMPSYQDDLLNLKDIEFLIIMKYKTDNTLLSISNKSTIHIGIIDEIYMDSLDITLINKDKTLIKSINIPLSIENPEKSIILLEDVLLDESLIEEGILEDSPVKKKGLFKDYKLNIKFILEDDSGNMSVVDEAKFKLSDKLKLKKTK